MGTPRMNALIRRVGQQEQPREKPKRSGSLGTEGGEEAEESTQSRSGAMAKASGSADVDPSAFMGKVYTGSSTATPFFHLFR